MQHEARERRAQERELERSLRNSVLGSYYPNESVSMNTSMVTVAYHIETIQRRKLPEPPRVGGHDDDEAPYANSTLSPDLIPIGQTSTPKLVTSSDECTDIDGYLKPTFNEWPQVQGACANNADYCTTVIPIESYVSSVKLENQNVLHQPERTTSPSSSVSSGMASIRPLIRK